MPTEQDRALFRQLFHQADTNNDGYLSTDELGAILNTFGEKIPQKHIGLIMKFVDRDSNSKLDINEFMLILERNLGNSETENELKKLLRGVDRKDKGFISKNDLQEIVEAMTEPPSSDDFEVAVNASGTNDDGHISIDDFVRMLVDIK